MCGLPYVMELELLGAMKEGVRVNRIHVNLSVLGSNMDKPAKNRWNAVVAMGCDC